MKSLRNWRELRTVKTNERLPKTELVVGGHGMFIDHWRYGLHAGRKDCRWRRWVDRARGMDRYTHHGGRTAGGRDRTVNGTPPVNLRWKLGCNHAWHGGRQAVRGAGEDDVVVAARGMSGGDPEAAHGTGRLALACMALKSEPWPRMARAMVMTNPSRPRQMPWLRGQGCRRGHPGVSRKLIRGRMQRVIRGCAGATRGPRHY